MEEKTMKYLFETTIAMKEYNNKKYWIDPNIIRDITIESENITEGLKKYAELVEKKHYISVSSNALKTKSPMYIDVNGKACQVGYVITGSMDFDNEITNKWSKQYIDLWVTVLTITDTDFEEEG
jgi:hypothetical protein